MKCLGQCLMYSICLRKNESRRGRGRKKKESEKMGGGRDKRKEGSEEREESVGGEMEGRAGGGNLVPVRLCRWLTST